MPVTYENGASYGSRGAKGHWKPYCKDFSSWVEVQRSLEEAHQFIDETKNDPQMRERVIEWLKKPGNNGEDYF